MTKVSINFFNMNEVEDLSLVINRSGQGVKILGEGFTII